MRAKNATTGWVLALGVLAFTRSEAGIIVWQWLAVHALAFACLAWFLAKRYGTALGLLMAWAAGSALWAGSPFGPYRNLTQADMEVLGSVTGEALLNLALFSGAAIALKGYRPARVALWVLALLDAVWVIFEALRRPETAQGGWGGLLGNPSMNGMLISALFPLAVRESHARFGVLVSVPSALLIAVAVVLAHSSMAIGTLCVAAIAWAALNWRSWFQKVEEEHIVAAILMAAAVVTVDIVLDPGIFSTTGRSGIWVAAVKWLSARHAWLFGLGGGTASAWIPVMQARLNAGGNTSFFFLHNDWLQITYELGLVGLALACAVFLTAVWRSRGTPHLCASILAFGASALGNWPLRSGPFALTAAILFGSALNRRQGGGA